MLRSLVRPSARHRNPMALPPWEEKRKTRAAVIGAAQTVPPASRDLRPRTALRR